MYREWEAVIGLEIHAQLSTQSKIFSSDAAVYSFGDNDHISPVSLGLPGTLPVLNGKVVDLAVKAGLALNCKINHVSVFERKNYFYPDLSKGYQISQYQHPICGKGEVQIQVDNKRVNIGIERAHLEEDAGKSLHQEGQTLINYNRAGVALLEIVSAPDMRSPSEAAEYARNIRQRLQYVGVCDGNMEEGSLRCDCNVSVRKRGQVDFGVRVELKNINSFRFIEKALEYEIHRQIDLIESGGHIVQETRLYDSTKNRTMTMRLKEEAEDYRYFPDPDLRPLVLNHDYVSRIRQTLPEMPEDKINRFINSYNLTDSEADLLADDIATADFFEKVVASCNQPRLAANWVLSDVFRSLNESKLNILNSPIKPEGLAELIGLIQEGHLSGKLAKRVFHHMWMEKKSARQILEEQGWKQNSDQSDIEKWVKITIENHPNQVEEFRSGKEKVISYLMGQVMKLSKGQANPGVVEKLLREQLK